MIMSRKIGYYIGALVWMDVDQFIKLNQSKIGMVVFILKAVVNRMQ